MKEFSDESVRRLAREVAGYELQPRDGERLVPLLNALRVEMRALQALPGAEVEPLLQLRLRRWTS